MTERAKKLLLLYYKQSRKIRRVSGLPPLTFKAKKAGTLKNYRIYGQTVDGESVGDRTGNLFSSEWIQGYYDVNNGSYNQHNAYICTKDYIPVVYGQTYSLSRDKTTGYIQIRGYDDSGQYLGSGTSIVSVANPIGNYSGFGTFTVTNQDVAFIKFNDLTNDLSTKYMMVEGKYTSQTMPPYEPYGYRVPVTVTNGADTETTNLYLPEQIKMVGDEAEYVDYATQKWHRVRKNLFDINNLEDGYDISLETGLPTRGSAYSYIRCAITTPINVSAGDYYLTFNKNIENEIGFIVSVFENNTFISRISGYHSGDRIQISSGNNIYIGFYNQNVADAIHTSDIFNIMLNSGSEPLPYEPYIESTEVDVTLPALPVLPRTNTLTVGTEVQPSGVEIKGRIKAAGGD